MKKKILFIIDPLEKLSSRIGWYDNSLYLAYEAQNYFDVYFCTIDDIFFEGETQFFASKLTIADYKLCKYSCTEKEILQDFTYILFRKDPPITMQYITALHLLCLVDKAKTTVLNNPESLLIYPEKIAPHLFANASPATLISTSYERVESFLQQHEQIILKPLYGAGSNDVFLINKDEKNLKFILSNLVEKYQNCPIVCQKFLNKIFTGDKRIIILCGKILGVYSRVPKSHIASVRYGTQCVTATLTPKENSICENVACYLLKNDLLLSVVDMIDENLIEINVTSPAGLDVLDRLYNTNAAHACLEAMCNFGDRNGTL